MSNQQPVAEVVEHAAPSTEHVLPAGNKRTNHSNRTKSGARASKSHQGHSASEEQMQASAPARKKPPASHKDKETRSRPPNSQRNHKEGSKGGGGASSQRERGHSGRHRNGNASLDSSSSSGGSGRAANNRWDRLDPDVEHETSASSVASSETWSKSSPSTSSTSLNSSLASASSGFSAHKGSEERRSAKRRGREAPRGRGSTRSQAQEGEGGESARPTGHNAESVKEDRAAPREDGGGQRKKAKQIKFDLPSQVSEQPVSEGVGQETGSGGGAVSEEKATDNDVSSTLENTATPAQADTTEPKKTKIIYDRDALLALRELSVCLAMPRDLRHVIDLLPQAYAQSIPSDSPFSKDTAESTDESGKPRHPTALSLIKEHDKHFVSKVSLSPQRRSFGRGCSWKDGSNPTSDAPVKTPPPKSGNSQGDNNFKFENTGKPQGPRVIHHVPLLDQEQAAGRHGKRNWRDGGGGGWKNSRDNNQHYAEPEPEWMEFGPTDRFDVIELKGFEEHEIERDGLKDSGTSDKERAEPDSHEPLNEEGRDKRDKPEQQEDTLLQDPSKQPTKQSEEDNEFILDGFDFSTSVSICQVLDLDEDEPVANSKEGVVTAPSSSHKPIKDPSELGNALLKALGVGKEEEPSIVAKTPPQVHKHKAGPSVVSVNQTPPANALTLEEVHARENIQPSPAANPPAESTSTGEGMEAFNKLLAVLESKQAKPSKEEFSGSSQAYPPHPNPSANPAAAKTPPLHKLRPPAARAPAEELSTPNYMHPLDKELLELETDLPSFPEPNLRRLEQLERMLESMDRMDPQLQAYHSSMPPHHRLHQVEQRLPPAQLSQLDRESRAWMQYHHQQQQQARGRPHPTMQQIAASRQQQMMGGVSRPPNNWAVEMEQRRVMELRQMQLAKEKELYGRASGHAVPSQVYNKGPSSKPNISLLPTAVMKHMHTSKPNQAAADLPKTTSISNRLDQDLTSKASQTHSVLNSLLNQNTELTPGPSPSPGPGPGPSHYPMHPHPMPRPINMRMAPSAGHNLPKAGDLPTTGSVYPRYPVPMPHGMHPYMY